MKQQKPKHYQVHQGYVTLVTGTGPLPTWVVWREDGRRRAAVLWRPLREYRIQGEQVEFVRLGQVSWVQVALVLWLLTTVVAVAWRVA